MDSALKISEAAGLAIHAVTILARVGRGQPVKLSRMAGLLSASEAHLGKVMHRLAQAKVVTSRRGPSGGFTLGPRASEMTLLDLYEMIDGPLGENNCLMGYLGCPLGGCVLGDAVGSINAHVRQTLGSKRISDLAG
ncbi:MAG: Rrf2 family transcriptional regulator [Myxococcota bacterium]|nr:Rrf2 family transcriptional regulator [Myxococcota bacterium]